MTKIRELSLVAVIILLLSIITIQSITNYRILSLIGQQPRQLSLPFISTIMKAGKQLQQLITGQNTDNIGNSQTAAVNPASFTQNTRINNLAHNFYLTGSL